MLTPELKAIAPARLTTPRAAAIAGVAFSLLLGTSLILIRMAVPADPTGTSDWLEDAEAEMNIAMALVPFAGIAFLWFIGVIRDQLGDLEDRFFSTVLFGSGLLFLAMVFIASAMAAGVVETYDRMPSEAIASALYTFDDAVIRRTMSILGIRMAGVFMISAGTIWRRSRVMPGAIVLVTFLLALIQLVTINYSLWMALVFPIWTLLVSCYILIRGPQAIRAEH